MGLLAEEKKSPETKHQDRALDELTVICQAGDVILEILSFLLSLQLNVILKLLETGSEIPSIAKHEK